MTTKKPTGFDSFFEAVSSTPEYKTIMNGMSDLSAYSDELKKMEKNTAKAGDIHNGFSKIFDTPEVREAGNKTVSPLSSKGEGQGVRPEKKTGDANSEEEVKDLIEVEYFENTEPATFGFKGVAGMQDLKDELMESFINPLKFQFFVQKLQEAEKNAEIPLLTREGQGVGSNSGQTQGTAPTNNTSQESTETNALYKDLYAAYSEFKVGIPTGVLFYGPPGTGKTYITKKLAEELGAGFIKKSVGELGSSYVHQTSKNIHNFFKQAKAASQKGPIILFLDEIDSLVSKRGGNVDASKTEEVSQFLQEFNNLDDAPNLVIIAATNRPDNLDSAILRSGRFDKKIYIGEPDFIARKELFEIFIAKKDRPHTKLDYRELAMLTEGYVAADIEAIVSEAARDASQGILDLVKLIQKGEHNPEEIRKQLEGHTISMELLRQAIIDTTSSLKMVDMSIYTQWLENLE